MKSQTIIDFWFNELEPAQWFKKSPDFDEMLKRRFGQLHKQAAQGECYTWRATLLGRLAEIIVLDQFSRNIYRDTPAAFAYDGMALVLCQEALNIEGVSDLPAQYKAFLYMPMMHSESLVIHQQALNLFAEPGLENNYAFEVRHYDIIKEFGRYPHRNAILGRESTSKEIVFLQQPGSSF